MVIIDVVFTLCCFLDEGVWSRYWNVVGNSHLRVLASPNFYLSLCAFFADLSRHFGNHVFSIDDVECFCWFTWIKTFEDNEVFGWVVHLDDVDDLVLVSYFEWEVDFAQFTV